MHLNRKKDENRAHVYVSQALTRYLFSGTEVSSRRVEQCETLKSFSADLEVLLGEGSTGRRAHRSTSHGVVLWIKIANVCLRGFYLIKH